jgi:hypothetical protein
MELQICGCRAMWNVSGNEGNQLAFVEAGGLALSTTWRGYLILKFKAFLAALGNLGAVE